MKQIRDNPALSFSAIKDKIKSPFVSLIVNPSLEKTATLLNEYFIKSVFRFKEKGEELTIEEVIDKHLFNFKVIVETKLKHYEWMLLTKDEIYYSKGDNTK